MRSRTHTQFVGTSYSPRYISSAEKRQIRGSFARNGAEPYCRIPYFGFRFVGLNLHLRCMCTRLHLNKSFFGVSHPRKFSTLSLTITCSRRSPMYTYRTFNVPILSHTRNITVPSIRVFYHLSENS